jgi:ADP-heptose:LPS heptosyltransferase
MSGDSDPVLVLQMQRMGDLILSFPLFMWLARSQPETPIWVVGSRCFYDELVGLSPKVTYFAWEESSALAGRRFSRVINISHRPEAAELSGRVNAGEKIGPVRHNGGTYVHGNWQLYRASLTANNRHSRFHWADLNALDAVPFQTMRSTSWPFPRTLDKGSRRVGLFLGASEAEKRPDPAFWASLVRELVERDLRPILLGGPGERGMGSEVVKQSGCSTLDLCGRLTLPQLAIMGQALQLMITPDTGPMHLGSWTGIKVLNLSMGPVNPWETGPYHPGHYVLSPDTGCRGCWTCNRAGHPCRGRFDPARVAGVATRIINDLRTPIQPGCIRPRGFALYRTTRDDLGLHALERLDSSVDGARELLGGFWHAFWAREFGLQRDEAPFRRRWEVLRASLPRLADRFAPELARFVAVLSKARHRPQITGTAAFWHDCPPLIRPLSGYIQHTLQNNDRSGAAFRDSLSIVERLLSGLG